MPLCLRGKLRLYFIMMPKPNPPATRILSWARQFRAGLMSADDVQDAFAALDDLDQVNTACAKRIRAAQQELDAIRLGMCERGQEAEINRIFLELEDTFRASGEIR